MNVSAIHATSPNPYNVSIRPTEATGSHAMFATEQRWCGVVTTNEKRRISTSRKRAVVRDILTEQHRPRKTFGSVVGTRFFKESGTRRFRLTVFRVTNFGCKTSGHCKKKKKRLQPTRIAHLMERVLDIGRTHKPVLSVLRRSLKFDMAKSLSQSNGPDGGFKKCRLLARA